MSEAYKKPRLSQVSLIFAYVSLARPWIQTDKWSYVNDAAVERLSSLTVSAMYPDGSSERTCLI